MGSRAIQFSKERRYITIDLEDGVGNGALSRPKGGDGGQGGGEDGAIELSNQKDTIRTAD